MALSDSGIVVITSPLLLFHFVKRKPPFSNNLAKLNFISAVLVDFIKSSTYMLRFTVSTTSASDSFR